MPGTYEGREPHVDTSPMGTESEVEDTETKPADDIEDVVEENETEEVDDSDDEEDTPNYQGFYDHLQTSDGALDFTVEALLALGYDIDAVEDILTKVPGSVDTVLEDEDDEDDDRVLTVKDLKELEKRQRAAQAAAAEQARAAQAAETLKTLVVSTVSNFRIDSEPLSPKQARAVTAYADDHLNPRDYNNPEAIKRALKLGLKDLEEVTGKRTASTVASKVAAKKRVPRAVKGGTAGGESESEPVGIDDAIKRARKRLSANGTI